MPPRKARRPGADYAHLTVKVEGCSAFISQRILNPKYDTDRESASSSITIEGALSEPVMRRKAASVFVHCREGNDPGAALGVNATHWQVLVYLPRAQFSDLMALVAAQRLARVEFLLDPLRRGAGRVRSAGFHTAPVPSEAED